ncbi:MAG: DUF2812 domain-containing protein [Clostridiales bacterium]|nr:DUF2812 domain-containing protein [Clostridiales bacterium]
MSKKHYRFFGALLNAQENWLNKMSANGYRLIRTSKLMYEFEECKPNEYEYQIEFIARKSRSSAQDYAAFLTEMGYKVFYKNINLNYSIGKVRLRPWAEPGGRIATNSTTYNRELLIVEKPHDGKPFELHSTIDDRIEYYKSIRAPWLFMLIIFALFGVIMRSWIFGAFALMSLIPTILYQLEIISLSKSAKTNE